jgi:hypothetical protein
MVKNKVLEHLLTLPKSIIRENGKMVFRMAKVLSTVLKVGH